MELISASRIVKAQQRVAASTPYANELTRAVSAVATFSNTNHPLTTESAQPKRAAVLIVTADRGMAGAYSTNAIKEAEGLIVTLKARGLQVLTYVVGRKAVNYYKFRNRAVKNNEGVDELHIVFTEFKSMVTQVALNKRMLPLEVVESDGPAPAGLLPMYEFEPNAGEVLNALLPRYIESRVYNALLQSAASEHAARRRAMKSATDNADELIKSLTRLANAARQAEITQEISEIVGGADALSSANAGSE